MSNYDNQRLDAFYSMHISGWLMKRLKEYPGEHPFASKAVRIIESDLPEEQRIFVMFGLLDELRDFYTAHGARIRPQHRELFEERLSCAKSEIDKGDYYFAVSDIENIESILFIYGLGKELSKMESQM